MRPTSPANWSRLPVSVLRVFMLILLALILLLAAPESAVGESDCSEVYNAANGWIIEKCETDPNVSTSMTVMVDGMPKGDAVMVRVSHRTEDGTSTPQVAVIYASGYVRLKPNTDPDPPIPFGSSFVLGPGYWPNNTTYRHNPQLTHLEIDTSWLPGGPLWMRAAAENHDFVIDYEMALPPPRDRQTRLHVTQTFSATVNIPIAPDRRAEHQGLKLVQVSSMYINDTGACDGGKSACHDSDGVRYIDADLARRATSFADLPASGFIFNPTMPLGSNWLDSIHGDDVSWQGNTPNVRIILDDLPADQTVTPQGWIQAATDPNGDNVGLWLHGDGSLSQDWTAGQSAQLGYWLVAEDNPPEPWQTLGLRSGRTFLDFEGSDDCQYVYDAAQDTTGTVHSILGYADTALQLDYDLGQTRGNWVQIRCNFNPPLDLSDYDHLRFDWRGSTDAANTLEVALVNPASATEYIFDRRYSVASHRTWWGQMVVPFGDLSSRTEGAQFDPSRVSAFFVSTIKDHKDDVGGAGSIAIDNLNAFNVISRNVPSSLESVTGNGVAAAAAVDWLVSQQQPSGLLRSWEEETACVGHTYDQALALLVFLRAGKDAEADKVAAALLSSQNEDGAWPKGVDCNDLKQQPFPHRWEGDTAWAIYALNHYLAAGGEQSGALEARDRATRWLSSNRIDNDGCLFLIDETGLRGDAFTEPVIDAWWAFQTAGPEFADEADGIKGCLLADYWDEAMGRFKGGKTSWQVNLDNQTWGAAFLAAIGEEEKARRALSYAKETLLLPAQGGHLFGFDGQGGPWAVWNEGTSQYVAVGGPDAQDTLREPSAMQRADGAVPGAPDFFDGGGVWTTRWHGVAPTAWLYFAHAGSPFEPTTAAPTASFSASETCGLNPLTVDFTNTSTGVYDTLLWDFGDGQTSGIEHPTHVYTAPGRYTVTLTVSGRHGIDVVAATDFIRVRECLLFLPLITVPLPGPTLTLNADNGGDGNYTVKWASVSPGEPFYYTLEEDDDNAFRSPFKVEISQTNSSPVFHRIRGQIRGDHYYRVQAALEPNSEKSEWSNTLAVAVDFLTIDDFEDGEEPNAIGHDIGWYGDCIIRYPVPYDPDNAYGGSSYGYRLPYRVTGGCYASWQTGLNGSDYSSFSTVTFMVKGAKGDEYAHVYLQNSPTQRKYVKMTDYLSDGNRVTKDWQMVRIPLSAYSRQGIDLTTLDYFQIVFEWKSRSGTIWVDDIQLK